MSKTEFLMLLPLMLLPVSFYILFSTAGGGLKLSVLVVLIITSIIAYRQASKLWK